MFVVCFLFCMFCVCISTVACAPKTATVPYRNSVCAGACAAVPPGVLENHAGGTSWDHYAAILDGFWSMLRPLGTILGALGTIFEAPFLRFGKNVDFRRFPGNLLVPLGTPFAPLGDTFSSCGASEAENMCFLGDLV